MPFFPRQVVRLQSQLSSGDATRALQAQVAAPRPPLSFGLRFGSLPFEGTISESGFEIQRIIQYRNSFLPQIRGTIEPAAGGCSVYLTMSLHPLVLGFSLVWLMGVSAAALVVGAAAWRESALSVETFIPLAMFSFFWLLVTASFHFEARKAEQLLREILVATRETRAALGGAKL